MSLRARLFLTPAIASVLALAIAGSAMGAPIWSQLGNSAQGYRRSAYIGPSAAVITTVVSQVPYATYSMPAVASNGTTYINGGGVHAYSATGTLLWSIPGSTGWTSCALSADEKTVYATMGGLLTAIDAATGAVYWQTVAVGNPLIIAKDGTLYTSGTAVNPDGTVAWSNVAYAKASALSPDESTLYTCSGMDIVAVVAKTGVERWRYQLPTGLADYNPLSVGPDGTIYAPADAVYAITPAGTAKWSKPFSVRGMDCGDSAVSVGIDGYLRVLFEGRTTSYGALACVDPVKGTARWTFQTKGFRYPAGNVVVDAANKSYFAALPQSDANPSALYCVSAIGKVVWSKTMQPNMYWSAPIPKPDGTMVFWNQFDNPGTIYRIAAQ